MGNTPQRPGMLAVDLLNVIRKVQHMVMRPLFTLLFYVFALLFYLYRHYRYFIACLASGN